MNIDVNEVIIYILFVIILISVSIIFNDLKKMRMTSMIGLSIVYLNIIIFNIYSVSQISNGINQKYSEK